jgi:uncharacterized protein involved in outer membrane biogenesis
MVTRRTRIAAALVIGVVGVLLAVPYVVPLSTFIPTLEARIAERVREPVKIGELRLFLLPLPYAAARDITIGKGRAVQVDSLILRPALLSLLSDAKIVHEVRLEGVRVRQEALKRIGGWAQNGKSQRSAGKDESGPSVRIERVTLRNGEIRFPTFTLKSLDADVMLQGGKPVEVRARQYGDRLRVSARPEGAGTWKLDIAARGWEVPIGLPLRLDRLEAAATLTAIGVSSSSVRGELYGGSFTGPVAVSWKPDWSVKGELKVNDVDIEPVVALLKRDLAVSGKLTADPNFTLRARDPSALLETLELQADFSVEQGAIQRVDLVAAAQNPFDRDAGKGGKTEFDRLVGHLVTGPGGYQFSDLEIASGLFEASGDVTVARDQKLEGRIDVDVKRTASLISIPLRISGTAQDPSLFPTKSAMAGAVAGSVLLPGIGTAVGIKASQFTDKLFGSKKPQRKKKEEAEKQDEKLARPAPKAGGR